MNKIGILYGYWCTEWDVDYMPYLEKVKRLGFDTLEINTLRLTKMSDAEIEHFMGRAKELQIDVLGVIGVPAKLDPAAPDAAVRKAGIDYEMNLIRTCAKAGIPCASGVLYSGWLSRLETHGATKAECWKHSISSMKEISALAEDLGVRLNLEVVNRFENYLINTCDEVMSYIADVGSPILYAHLDTFHMNIEENSMSGAILTAGSRLGHFHVGENNRKPPRSMLTLLQFEITHFICPSSYVVHALAQHTRLRCLEDQISGFQTLSFGTLQMKTPSGGTTNGPGPRIRGGPGSVGSPLLFEHPAFASEGVLPRPKRKNDARRTPKRKIKT